MPDLITALLVPDDETVSCSIVSTTATLPALTQLIGGGPLEFVGGGAAWHAYCDEEGKLNRLPINVRATRLARVLGWTTDDVLCGPVVFLGDKRNGDEANVPARVLVTARTLGYLRPEIGPEVLSIEQIEALNELVATTAERIAANAIDTGDQVNFLLAHGLTIEAISEAIDHV